MLVKGERVDAVSVWDEQIELWTFINYAIMAIVGRRRSRELFMLSMIEIPPYKAI